MYKVPKFKKTTIKKNETQDGETIEQKIARIVNNNEPITDGAPIIYTERKEGVRPEYDIRTDRFELAVDAMDKVTKDKISKREERANLGVVKGGKEEKPEPGTGTNGENPQS